ncbi:class I tRNA ligase family protein [Pseudomonas bananamidigenes]|uniref:class I tRNA ligase family protein n=1 Tax=Pseudomonas bananamidigenes TaxID=2843610 RepID=UPI000803BFCA|nr:class I tRNA ligase family protein [Pseudomonas bananamidigenes]
MKITRTFPASFDVSSGQMNARDITVAPSQSTRIHNHHDSECWKVLSGEGVLTSGSRQFTIRAGDHVEFQPFEAHTVENRSGEALRFTSYWHVDHAALADRERAAMPDDGHLLIETAFPTPNGPLHLGHLSGAYLLADVFKRCCELTGTDAFAYCGTYGHTNHIDKTAIARGTTYTGLVESCESVIVNDLQSFQVEYDAFLPHVPDSPDFAAVKERFLGLLLESGYLSERIVEHPYSEASGQFICESYVAGQCPHCRASTIGMECENCGLYQDECKLIEPFHSVTREKLVRRPVARLYLRLDQAVIGELAAQMYSHNTVASRICYDRLQQYLKDGALGDIPVSSLRGRGVPVKGEQVLTVVMERALRSFFGLSRYPSATGHLFFCGVDNLCGSGILLPYVLKVLGVAPQQLPVAVINQFSLLDGRKFSTGANHAIWASEFLQTYPADLVRLYLCQILSPTSESNFRREAFNEFTGRFVQSLTDVFANGRELIGHFADGCIEAGPWLRQDVAFYRELNAAMDDCLEHYASHAPHAAVRRIVYLLEVIADYTTQSHAWRDDRNALRTRIALMLHAWQSLAYCLYPAMPVLATQIFEGLGAERDRWHADRQAVRIFEIAALDIDAIAHTLSTFKHKVSPT